MRTGIYIYSKSVVAIPTTTIAANGATNGETVDLFQDGEGDYKTALLVVHSGAVGEGTHVVTVEYSDDGLSWSAADSAVKGSIADYTTTDDNVVREVGYTGEKRYVRLVVTTTGITTGNAVLRAAAVLFDTHGYRRGA